MHNAFSCIIFYKSKHVFRFLADQTCVCRTSVHRAKYSKSLRAVFKLTSVANNAVSQSNRSSVNNSQSEARLKSPN